MPEARSEVAAARAGGEIVVAGGFTADGNNSPRVDAYSVRSGDWRRLPDLPVAVDHAAAAGVNGRVYVIGGYGEDRLPRRSAFVLEGRAWREIASLPDGRAAAAAAIAGGRLYVVGGRNGRRGLARDAFVLSLGARQWIRIPGPRPREHLAATAVEGRVYAIGGRAAGDATNTARFEVYDPTAGRWQRPPLSATERGAGRGPPRWPVASSRSAERSPQARSAASTRTTCGRAAGRGCPISRRRGTASASSLRAAASGPLRAVPSPGSPSAERWSRCSWEPDAGPWPSVDSLSAVRAP